MTNKDTLKVNKNRYFCRIIYELIKNMEKMQETQQLTDTIPKKMWMR